MRYVELVGLPGAGKTSIANHMEKHFDWVAEATLQRRFWESLSRRQGWIARIEALLLGKNRQWPRFGNLASVTAEEFVSATKLLNAAPTDRGNVGAIMFRTLAELGGFRQYSLPGETCIHAEGVQQRRFSFAIRGVNVQDKHFPLPASQSAVAVVDVSPGLAEQRRRKRAASRDINRDWSDAPAALESVLESLPPGHLVIDGSLPLEEIGRQLYAVSKHTFHALGNDGPTGQHG